MSRSSSATSRTLSRPPRGLPNNHVRHNATASLSSSYCTCSSVLPILLSLQSPRPPTGVRPRPTMMSSRSYSGTRTVRHLDMFLSLSQGFEISYIDFINHFFLPDFWIQSTEHFHRYVPMKGFSRQYADNNIFSSIYKFLIQILSTLYKFYSYHIHISSYENDELYQVCELN